jgi:hypothetical protein
VAPLPFELVVLEMALGDICSVLDRMARDLDLQCGPALEALTRDVIPTDSDSMSVHADGCMMGHATVYLLGDPSLL